MENGFYGYTWQGILNFASDFGIFASENETYWHIFASGLKS